ncbi:Retrotransposon protein [Salix suchowensis]|nr:Retrotransposon protein [Salix suchowensis]
MGCDDVNDDEHVAYVMLPSISPEFQVKHENIDVHIMIMHIKELFDETSKTERHEITKDLFRYKIAKGFLVNTYFLKIIGYIDKSSQLVFVMDHELGVDLVLQSLS